MPSAEQKTWDFLTWVHDVNVISLEFDVDDYGKDPKVWLTYGELMNGQPLSVQQLQRYEEYYPELIEDMKSAYIESLYDIYMGG